MLNHYYATGFELSGAIQLGYATLEGSFRFIQIPKWFTVYIIEIHEFTFHYTAVKRIFIILDIKKTPRKIKLVTTQKCIVI